MERIELGRLLAPGGPVLPPPAEPSAGPRIVEERDPRRFMDAFAQAVASDREVFLADPAWGSVERAALAALTSPGPPPPASPPSRESREGWLMIPSGGTGGRLKFARHDQETIGAAVRGFCAHFQVPRVNCVGVLPLHHVSGLMAWMRSALTGGSYLPWDWKRLETGDFPPLPHPGSFLSLVPTQLQRLLLSREAISWLRGFDAIFIGGGPTWKDLAAAAARAQLPISLSYGMTETAAMVTALHPREFLEGARSCGTPLAHARLDLTGEGWVRVSGESVFRGYFPQWQRERSFTTEDTGAIDGQGHLLVLGRRDAVIITGGEKVDPREPEEALRASGEFSDIAIVGMPDAEWGEALVACYPGNQPAPNLERVAPHLAALAAFKRPRRYVPIPNWPRNAQGKINRAALVAALRA